MKDNLIFGAGIVATILLLSFVVFFIMWWTWKVCELLWWLVS